MNMFEFAVQEGCLDIHLMDFEVELSQQGKKDPNGDPLYYWSESFVIINWVFLTKTFCNDVGFILLNLSIRTSFQGKYPVTPNDVVGVYVINVYRNVSLGLPQGSEFFQASFMPYQARISPNYWVSGSPSCIPNTLPHSFPIFPIFSTSHARMRLSGNCRIVPTVCVCICQIPDLACQECQTPATSGTTNIGFLKNQSCKPWEYAYPQKATDEENPFTTLE